MSYVYKKFHTVAPQDIDQLNHVNNLVYLQWFIDANLESSESVGWPMKRYLKEGSGWVIRRHEIDYLAPAFLGEELIIMTWIESVGKSSAVHQYKIVRVKDERVLAKGNSVLVWLDYKTGLSLPIPNEVRVAFNVDESASALN